MSATANANAIMVIKPYLWNGMWVFDDEAVGLRREPFVSGMDAMIENATADIPNAAQGFLAVFSAGPFPGARSSWTDSGSRGAGTSTAGRNKTWKAGSARHC